MLACRTSCRPTRQAHGSRPPAAANKLGNILKLQIARLADNITPAKQIRKRNRSPAIATFPDCHRPHGQSCDSPGTRVPHKSSRVFFVHLRRHSTSCQHKHPTLSGLVDRRTNGIPKRRNFLPLINQPRIRPLQQSIWSLLGQLTIGHAPTGIGKENRAFRYLLGCRCFSTPLRPSYKNRPHIRKLLSKQSICNSWLIFIHLPKLYHTTLRQVNDIR